MEKWCIGVDFGGTFIKFGLLDSHRRHHGTFQLPTPRHGGADAVIAQIITGGKKLMAAHDLSRSDVLGVGIGSPGPIDISNGIIHGMPNVEGMTNVPIRDRVAEGLSLPAVLENDANAAAFGEYLCGAGRGCRTLVVLTLGTGTGSGVIIDGKVLHGSHEIGAELGHMIVVPDGELCGCGQRGCLERYTSARYMAEYAHRLIEKDGRPSSLSKHLSCGGCIDSKAINEARRAGDALAAEVWDRSARFLAIGCVSICRIFDPDKIVLTGGLTKAGEDLLEPVREHFRRQHWKVTATMTEIVFSELGTDAGVIGAAGVARQAFAP